MVADGHSAGCRKAVFATYGDGHSGLSAPAQIAGLRAHGGLRGHSTRTLRSQRQRGHRQRDAKSCNQLKPQTAAVNASHVHLLQISRKNRVTPG